MTTTVAALPEEEELDYDAIKADALANLKTTELALVKNTIIPLIEAHAQKTIDEFRELAFEPAVELVMKQAEHSESLMIICKEYAGLALAFGTAAGFISETGESTGDCPPPLVKAMKLLRAKMALAEKNHAELQEAAEELTAGDGGEEGEEE